MKLTLGEWVELIPGATLIRGEPGVVIERISTDTRTPQPRSLFVALKGERFDAHDFAHEAVQNGALALVVDQPLDLPMAQVLVADTRKALGEAARGWRARFRLPLIAVTGSNGKTTVTQMVASILAAAHGEEGRLATRGNLNNDIGVPLTLFRLNEGHRSAVIELGMNHPGEIATLAAMAQPTVALVNNAQREHQEFMGTVEATAHENGAVIQALPENGVAVFPADDDCAPIWRIGAGRRPTLDFGFVQSAAVRASSHPQKSGLRLALETPMGGVTLDLPLLGTHNAHNAAAAATAALAAGISLKAIRSGLESFRPVAGRGVIRESVAGAIVIDDSYNANPDSVRAAIDLLAELDSPRLLILGDMGEVGLQGPEFHAEIGEYASQRRLDGLLALGDLSRHAVTAFNRGGAQASRHFDDREALIEEARQRATPQATLLVKGSRFMRMEQVVEALCKPPSA
jgi:UDP-N-acetylmuramoyl-tripeptide--D-alanyl-D-alanine ligase